MEDDWKIRRRLIERMELSGRCGTPKVVTEADARLPEPLPSTITSLEHA